MGNTSSINTEKTDNVKDVSNTETINWNNVQTEDMGVKHTPPTKQLSLDIKELISKLQAGSSETDENFTEDILETALKNKQPPVVKNNFELSDTSPFITSDIYNYLNNTDGPFTNTKQAGGAAKKSKKSKNLKQSKKSNKSNKTNKTEKQLKGTFEDSSTTETSSASSTYKLSSSTNDVSSSTGGSVKKTENKVSRKSSRKNSKKKDHRGSGVENNSSYLSSSAHTEHNFSESNNASVTNENMNHSAISINTSDINMVSEY